MKDLLKKDLKIKIIAILAAILLWLYVYNVSNPMQNQVFLDIPLKIINMASLDEKDLNIKNDYKKTIDITIRGRQEALNRVRNSDFVAVLDFSKVNSAEETSIKIDTPECTQKDVTIESFSPSSIEIDVVKIKNNTFPIEITPNITLKPGYKVMDISPAIDSIKLEGEEADIDSVDIIKGKLDLKDLDRDVTKRVELKVYSKNNKEIPSLSKNLSVEVKVTVAKEVPLNLVVTGTPDAEYVEVSRSVTPNTVRITGAPEALAAITSLSTEPVSVEGIKQDLNATGTIKLPNGIRLADQPKEVAVNIDIEQLILKDLVIVKDAIGIKNAANDNTMNYEIKTESAAIQVKGRSTVLNALDIASLKPTVDITGLDEGTHKIPLNISLPTQVKLMTEVQVEVKVTKVPETTEGQ